MMKASLLPELYSARATLNAGRLQLVAENNNARHAHSQLLAGGLVRSIGLKRHRNADRVRKNSMGILNSSEPHQTVANLLGVLQSDVGPDEDVALGLAEGGADGAVDDLMAVWSGAADLVHGVGGMLKLLDSG